MAAMKSTTQALDSVTLSSLSDTVDVVDVPSTAVQDPKLGEILIRTKGLSPDQVQRALDYQKQHGVRFGEAIVKLGFAGNDEVLSALAQQFHYPFAAAGQGNLAPELVVARKPFDADVEIFRDLRTQLLLNGFGSADDRAALAIVSAGRGDGKTFTAANLAIAFGQLPGRTLLVDADLRSPRLHELFNCPASAGLAGVLSGRSEASLVRPLSDMPNLYLLPVGTMPPNPSELILEKAFIVLLNELTAKFDYVIVDTPAASHGSDARVIASRCGASLVVARKNHTRLPDLQLLVEQMQKSRVKVTGALMNEF